MPSLSGLVSLLLAAWLWLVAGQAILWGGMAQREAMARGVAWEHVYAMSRRLAGDVQSAVPGGVVYVGGFLRVRSESGCVEYAAYEHGLRYRRLDGGCGVPVGGWVDAATGSENSLPVVLVANGQLCGLEEDGRVVLVWMQDGPCSLGESIPRLSLGVGGHRLAVPFPAVGVRTW